MTAAPASRLSEEQWPPESGIPEKKRFKKARKLEWGETPFDDLTRAELLRLVQAYHATMVSARSVMKIHAEMMPSTYWTEGTGFYALREADHLLSLAGENDPDPASEKIYRSFFRTARVLLFPFLRSDKFHNWGINAKGEMVAPCRDDPEFRPIEWRDVLPAGRRAVADASPSQEKES